MKKIFELTNKYIILATPLILFSLFSSIYLTISMQGKNLLSILISFIILFLMCVAFMSGWGKMVKSAALEEEPNEPNSVIKVFPAGVGEYFLPSLGLISCTLIINFIFLAGAYAAGMHFIGNPHISMTELSNAMATPEALKTFLASLSKAQLLKINLWNFLILGTMSLTSFLLLFYLPAMFFNSKNPFKALFISVKNIFSKKFFRTLAIYLLIFAANFIISLSSAMFAGNVFMNFIMTLINFYFICCVVLGIFCYYHENFVKVHIGTNVDTYI